MHVNSPYLLVNIDKAAQLKKQDALGSINLDPRYLFMLYNLQHAPILQISKSAQELFPQAEVGDIAIFHHSVESNPNFLVEYKENRDEVRVARITSEWMDNQVYGIVKDRGVLIPHPDWVFVHPKVSRLRVLPESKVLAQMSADMYEDEDYLKNVLNELNNQKASLDQSFRFSTDIAMRQQLITQIDIITTEQNSISKLINSSKVVKAQAMYIPENLQEEYEIAPLQHIVVSDANSIIPLMVDNKYFGLVMKDLIVASLD